MLRFDGKLLRQKRVAAGRRREAVAVAIGRSMQSVIAYENGRIDPPVSVVGRLAAVLACSPNDFYNEDPTLREAVDAVVSEAPPLTADQAATLRSAGLKPTQSIGANRGGADAA